ncbi:MAG: hypothetical protein LBQ87_07130 [Candidatus Fibromonas sp.]|nr:hypothetical protein [Candidatus Fibromonas sp.]
MPFLFITVLCLISAAFAEDSLKISGIYINAKDVFDDAVTHTSMERSLYRLGNFLHIETRESVIRAKLPFSEGDTISYSEIQDAEKNLRALSYISDAKIEAKGDSLGNTDLYVETSDNWTFSPAISLGKPGEKWLWSLGLLESNLLGLGHTVGFFFEHAEDRDQKYLLYRTDDFLFPHNTFSFLLSENSDGFFRYVGLSYPFISRSKNQWAYSAEWLWSERDEKYYEGLREDSLSLWLSRSFGRSSFKTYLGAGYDYHLLDSRDSRLGFSLAASRVKPDKRYNLHRVKWAEDVESGYYIKSVVAKNFKELNADNDDWFFLHRINLSLGTGRHYFLTSGQNSFYYNSNDIRDMHNTLFGEYILKPALEWSSVLNVQIDSWQKTTFIRELYLDGNSIFPGFPAYYLKGQNTFAFKAEQRYFPGFEILAQIPSFAVFLTAGQATERLRDFEPDDLTYMAGIGLRVSNSKSVQGVVNHINLSWPLNDKLNKGFMPRFSFVGKLGL